MSLLRVGVRRSLIMRVRRFLNKINPFSAAIWAMFFVFVGGAYFIITTLMTIYELQQANRQLNSEYPYNVSTPDDTR